MTNQEWTEIRVVYEAFWPHAAELSDEVWDVWHMELEAYDPDRIMQAIRDFSRRGAEFPPVVGQISHAIDEALRSAPPLFGEFYEELHHNAGSASWTSIPEDMHWSDPRYARIARMIGWDAFMNSNSQDPAMRAHARRCFDDAMGGSDQSGGVTEMLVLTSTDIARIAG